MKVVVGILFILLILNNILSNKVTKDGEEVSKNDLPKSKPEPEKKVVETKDEKGKPSTNPSNGKAEGPAPKANESEDESDDENTTSSKPLKGPTKPVNLPNSGGRLPGAGGANPGAGGGVWPNYNEFNYPTRLDKPRAFASSADPLSSRPIITCGMIFFVISILFL